MADQYTENGAIFKALADPNRLRVFELLSCCELCACDMLETLNITQPTLSHHMKILCGCGLVRTRKEGKCIFYSLNATTIQQFLAFFKGIIVKDCDCILGGTCTCEHCANPAKS